MESKDFRLASCRYGQVRVRIELEDRLVKRITLISYATNVIDIGFYGDGAYWDCSGTYSRTTAKHIGKFTREFLGENLYFTAKDIAMTGEVLTLTPQQVAIASQRAYDYYYRDASYPYNGNY